VKKKSGRKNVRLHIGWVAKTAKGKKKNQRSSTPKVLESVPVSPSPRNVRVLKGKNEGKGQELQAGKKLKKKQP